MIAEKPLTRDELSDAIRERYRIQISYDMLRRNEHRWGLDAAKIELNARVLLFDVDLAFIALDRVFRRPA